MKPGELRTLLGEPVLTAFGAHWVHLPSIVAVTPTFGASGKRSLLLQFAAGSSLFVEDDAAIAALDAWLAAQTPGKVAVVTPQLSAHKAADLRQTACEYRRDVLDGRPFGYVTIFEGEATGWCLNLLNPRAFVAGNYAVSDNPQEPIFQSVGGDYQDGAVVWTPVEIPN